MNPLLPLCLLVVGGCCGDAFCRDHVMVRASSGSPLQPGQWTFTFTTASDSWSFDCSFPTDAVAPFSPECGDTGPRPDRQGAPSVMVSDARTWWLEVASTPAELTVKVARNGIELATQTLRPSYVTSRPNGPLCAPECTQSIATVELP